ncbi:glutathione S-transferase family protein [Spongiibacter sp. KMU-158]|uniref:Glutathione S-transferase family protein n=1 Tax=Spongiibacter pelagi TaxID=2760804 RepID=A0A927GVF8_9GAMM|nr:glutathione S-transferase family protein [Spongiibacter pelagi]MBD2857374.1 glutathione S-transferase family protein [Spongiibacter pelagi]
MLKLYGFAVSNYFNMVKHVLLYKGVEFEEVTVFPGQDPKYLSKSPVGKVPCIETERGALCETSVILDYLEARYPDKPLMPEDAWQQAKVREVMKIAELYLELSGRKLFPQALMGKALPEPMKVETREVMQKACAALAELCSFTPYAMGTEMTLADIALRYSLVAAEISAQTVYAWDLAADVPGMKTWQAMMADSEISQQLDHASQEMMPAFMEYLQQRA